MLLSSKQNNMWSPLIGGTGGLVVADPVEIEIRATLASPE